MNDTSRTLPVDPLHAPQDGGGRSGTVRRTEPDACPIVFDDPAQESTSSKTPARIYNAVTFDDAAPAAAGPARMKPVPTVRPIVFDDPAPVRRADAATPPKAAPAASAVTFASPDPTPARSARGPTAPSVMVGAADSNEVTQAIALAKQQGGAAWQRAPMAVEGAIRQLLPFTLERLVTWGNSALLDNARLVEAATSLQRAQSMLGVNEIIQQALEARTPRKGFLERLRGAAAPVNPDTLRVRAAGISARLAQLGPQIEALRTQVREQAMRMDVLVEALSSAAQVGGNRLDSALDSALQNRRTVLMQASQQAQLLLPQIEEMRRQLIDHEARLAQFISVTLPAMDLAAAQAGG